ncbi:MAG: DNA recombination protein RmuC [bacterium]
MNQTLIFVLLFALLLVVAGILIAIWNKLKKPQDDQSMMLLQNQINELTRQLTEQMRETNDSIQKQYGSNTKMIQQLGTDTTKTIQEVTEKLTKLDDTNKRVVEFATQLQSLENILKNPKHRGILGEYFLEDLLSKVMPQGTYKMQYKFKDGEIVDAALVVKDRIIPIDAKFSLEKYNQIQEENDKIRRVQLEKEFKMDLKNRIDETAKYIRPEENTTDFAIMFIPAEGIFYNLLVFKVGASNVNSEDLINYAFTKKVIIVSPNTFFAYLQTILQALNALKIEQSVKEVMKNIVRLGKHLKSYQENFEKVGNHLSTTVGAYNNASKEFRKVDKDVLKISGVEMDSQQNLLDKPQED